MPNTFTTNFNLTKPEIGGANDTWGTLVNTNLDDVDTALYRKADKLDQKGVAHTLSFDSNNNFVTTNVARGFASFAVGDKITISHSGNAANKGEFKIEGITNDITIDLELLNDTEPSFVTESISSTVSIISEIDKVIGGLDVSGDTLTTSTAQKDAIVDGSSAISRNAGGIKSISITTAGTGYSGSGTLSASGGAGTGFAGAYTVSSGAVATIDITNSGSGYTSVPTIAVSGSNSGASTDAVITAVLQTTNDVIFASDVSITGGLNTGSINSTGSLTFNGDLTVSSGSIAEAVTMTGVPRKTKFIIVVPSGGSGQFSTSYTNTTEYATHDSVHFESVQGKTYFINVKYRTWGVTNSDQQTNTYAVKLYYGSTVCAYEATGNVNGGSFGTVLDYRPHSFQVEGLSGSSSISDGGGVVSGAFTEGASGTTDNYVTLVMFNQNQNTRAYMDFNATYQYCLFTIQEYDSDNFTSHNMQS